MPLTKGQRIWQVNHERLFEAALREIERVGFNDVRIEKICEETRLSRPTFYAHFSNKDSVVTELLCRSSDGIGRRLEARTKGSDDLESVIDELVGLCQRASSLTPEPLRRALAAHLPRHHDIDLFASSSVYTILRQAIVRAAQRQEIGPVSDPRALARRIVVVINGCFVAHPKEPRKAAREALEVLQLMLQGLRSR
jgi:AcrR family transcriptional regulator